MNFFELEKRLENNEEVTFTFVGDSITHGLNNCTADQTYVAEFAKLLATRYPKSRVVRYDGIVKDEKSSLLGYQKIVVQEGNVGTVYVFRSGVGGNTVARALKRIDDYTGLLPSNTYSDYIFTMFGINDALKSDPDKYVLPEVFKEYYRELICKLKASEKFAKLFIMTATTNDQCIDNHVALTYDLAKEENLSIIDLHLLWKNHYDKNADNFGHGDWLAPNSADACHPMPKATKAMAQAICSEFFNIIKA